MLYVHSAAMWRIAAVLLKIFFPDRDVAGDLLTKYYTDYEPQSTFVAECDGRLIGYINGCMDNRRYGLVMFWILMPALLAHQRV